MRLLMTGLTLFVALCLTAPAGDAFAPQPELYTGATVEFRDWTGDRITSDGNGIPSPYVDGGSRGLEVRVWINGSQDVTVGTFQSGRKIHFSYTPATDPGLQQPTTNPPSGSLVDNAFMNVRNIGAMVVGTTKITRAGFNTAVGNFRWGGAPNPKTGATTDPSYGSQAVAVTRTSKTTWDVRTPVPAESGYLDGSPTPVDYTAGDLNILLKEAKGKLTPVGLYHMAFGVTVTCPLCP